MRFRVPQFIDIEDKIFGPFTFRQFIYLLGGGGACFVLYKVLPLFVAVVLIVPLASFSLALAFYKPNGKPFLHMLEAGFTYYVGDKLYVWKKDLKKKKIAKKEIAPSTPTNNEFKNLSESKLKDIAWSLDVLDMKNKRDR